MSNRKTVKPVVKPGRPRSTGSFDIYFGEKLRARRLMMVPKVSQEELGAALGVTFQQVQKYEKGKKPYERGGPRMIDAFLKLKTDKLRSAVADLAQALARAG